MTSLSNYPPKALEKIERLQQQFDQDPVLKTIQQNLPPAFVQASPQAQKEYCRALLASRLAKAELKKLLKPLKGLSEFAKPLLSKALDDRIGPGLDVINDTLYDPALRIRGRTAYRFPRLSLLEAALHNFEPEEAVAGGFLNGAAITRGEEDHPKKITPEQFADVCRHVNLGRKYQDHLASVLEPDAAPGDASDAARFNARSVFIQDDKAEMEVCARAALIKKTISEAACSTVVAVARQQPEPRFNGELIRLERLTLLDVEIPRVVLIRPQRTWTFTQVPLVLYIPQDPVSPLKEYANLTELEDDLRSRLMDASYRSFFARFIGERKRVEFFSRLERHLFPLTPLDGNRWTTGLWEHAPDHKADLVLDTEVIEGNLFSWMYTHQMFLLKDNARFLAVPTEDEDAKSRQERLKSWLAMGMNIANVAAFFVPGLGQIMLALAAVDLVSEVYHGLEDLSHGDLEEGLDHLMGVAENIAFMVALGKAASAAELPEPALLTSNQFVGEVVPVKLLDGKTRLWKPELTPFQSSVKLPEGATPDIEGVFEQAGKKYLSIDEQLYEVQHRRDLNKWSIKHPDNGYPFSPELEGNGVGAFRHTGEKPEQWARDTLFKRLGHSVSGLSNAIAEQILAVTEADESLLRQVHAQSAVMPGQLSDTIKRFQLDRQSETLATSSTQTRAALFEQRYRASEVSSDPLVQLLQRDFPTLPLSVAEDLLASSLPAERQQMLETARVPLRYAEAAAWHVRQTRLNRALEGFYLKSVVSPDTETISLHLLESLPGWSDQVRLEVRQGSVHGVLLDSIGSEHAAEFKTLVKFEGGYQAFDAQGNALNNLAREGNNLYDSILHALPDGPRRVIGLPHVAQGPALAEVLAKLATSDRIRTARLLGQRDEPLKFNAPKRMKEGRLGYALSGRGRLSGDILEEHLLDKIRLLELQWVSPEHVLADMRSAGLSNVDINARLSVLIDEQQALRSSLSNWAEASSAFPSMSEARMAGRTRIGKTIEFFWQLSSVPITPGTTTLSLNGLALSDFPTQLPDFIYSRIQRLELVDTVRTFDPVAFPARDQAHLHQLEQFLSRFSHITSLEITRSGSAVYRLPNYYDLPRVISTSLPRLRALSLINQNALLSPRDINLFGGLSDLERLDLSGNFVSTEPGDVHLNLQQLSLDRGGMANWPAWLDSLVPGQIRELSLVDNHITHLPEHILSNPLNPQHTMAVSLQGNRLPRSTLLDARLREAGPNRSFRFNLDIPADLQSQLETLLDEQAALDDALRDWPAASSSTAPLSEATVQSRRQICDTVMRHWRNTVTGQASLPVRLESINLADFPRLLPETFYRNVNGIELRNVTASVEQLSQFLRQFQQLTSLDIVGHVPPLVTPPQVLAELPNLRELGLIDQGMLLDQQAMEFVSRLSRVAHLDLSGNQMGQVVDSPVLRDHYWQSLSLDNTGLQRWPEWFTELLPGNISSLSLARNQITELPTEILDNPNNDWSHTEISLEGNPLSRETMIAAHVSDYGNRRSFSFYMDLPDDILSMPTERASSESDASEHEHAAVSPVAVNPALWIVGSSEQVVARWALWDQLETADDAPFFMALIGRLQESADFQRTRDALTHRVWHILDAAAQDAELRALLNAMADEAIASRTCGDGVRLEFNQMEVQVFTRDSLRDVVPAERGSTLYRLMRRLFRLDEVDRFARRNTRNRDEAEVRLSYRLGLAERLDLPLPPANMLYRTLAGVTNEELLDVQARVLESQNGETFLSAAANRDFWTAYLREEYSLEFTQLRAGFDLERVRLEDQFPEINDGYLEWVKALDTQQKDKELNLIKQLTHREGVRYDE